MNWLVDRLLEKSTWITIATLMSAFAGSKVLPDHANTILIGAVSLLSALGITVKELK